MNKIIVNLTEVEQAHFESGTISTILANPSCSTCASVKNKIETEGYLKLPKEGKISIRIIGPA